MQRGAFCCLLSVLMVTLSATAVAASGPPERTNSAARSEPCGYVPPMITERPIAVADTDISAAGPGRGGARRRSGSAASIVSR